MQLFGLEVDASHAASFMCDTHIHSQVRETTQILFTALWLHDVVPKGKIDCSAWGAGKRPPYKPFSQNHPIVQWAAGSRAHYAWTLAHAHALAAEYEHRTGKKHMCEAFIQHVAKHVDQHGLPDSMPATATPDQWLEWVDEDKREQWEPRIATKLPPKGCQFGIVALKDFELPDPDDWVGSYKAYYLHKRVEWANKESRPITMTWSAAGEMGAAAKKRKRESHEEMAIA